ncbi:MAG: hypothetical protein PVH65_10825 [Chloroflexota bacterium]
MSGKRRSLLRTALWLAAGVALGVTAGFLVGWVIWPIEFTEADPTVLEESYQRDYTVMIAAAYDLDGDLVAARRRLASLGKDDADGWLLTVTVDHILGQEDDGEIRQLVRLATDLGLDSPLMAPYMPGLDSEAGQEQGP